MRLKYYRRLFGQMYGRKTFALFLFTILVKLLLLPMTLKQQKSLEQTQKLQPLVQELQKKYGNNQQKFAEEYQKHISFNADCPYYRRRVKYLFLRKRK